MKNNTWKCLFQWNQALNSGRDGSWPNAFDIQPLIEKTLCCYCGNRWVVNDK